MPRHACRHATRRCRVCDVLETHDFDPDACLPDFVLPDAVLARSVLMTRLWLLICSMFHRVLRYLPYDVCRYSCSMMILMSYRAPRMSPMLRPQRCAASRARSEAQRSCTARPASINASTRARDVYAMRRAARTQSAKCASAWRRYRKDDAQAAAALRKEARAGRFCSRCC